MARRRGFRRYRSRGGGGGFRSFTRRARGGGGGGGGGMMKNMIDGAIVGVANTALPEMIPGQDALVTAGVGWFRKNQVLQVQAGEQLGALLGSMVGGAIGTGSTQQGGFL